MSADDVSLPKPQQVRLRDLTTRDRNRLRQEAHDEVEPKVWAHYLGAWEGLWETFTRKRAEADRIIADNRPRPLSEAQFRMMKACLHPDVCHLPHAAEMFQLFSRLERLLVTPAPPRDLHNTPPLPATLAELDAMRAARTEQLRQAREARKQARQKAAEAERVPLKRGN